MSQSRSEPPAPANVDECSVVARVAEYKGQDQRLDLLLPADMFQKREILAGRYLLARCSTDTGRPRSDWSIYLRRPLFISERQRLTDETRCSVYVPAESEDAGYEWLRRRQAGDTVNLIGPLGNGFQLQQAARNLLLLVDYLHDPGWLHHLLPLVEAMLNQGGQITVLVRAGRPLPRSTLAHFPLAVEVQTALDEDDWRSSLSATLRWADQLCAGVPASRYSELAYAVSTHRFHVGRAFAQVLVETDLVCGIGACLACVVPLPGGGVTRACVHGPVFDLMDLTRG